MARLSYTAITSLDGYVEDGSGSFAWAEPDEEVHRFANDLDRAVSLHLYGRRMYETMLFWEDPDNIAEAPEFVLDYGTLWRNTDKVVFSRTLAEPRSERTRLEREFDPEVIRRWKSKLGPDIAIGGAELAGVALRAGLVDDMHVLLAPVLVGGGKRAFPDAIMHQLELIDVRAFSSGFAYLRYTAKV